MQKAKKKSLNESYFEISIVQYFMNVKKNVTQ